MKTPITLLSFAILFALPVFSSPVNSKLLSSNHTSNQSPGSERISVNLSAINMDGTISLQDGNLTIFDPSYSNTVDLNDLRKLNNFAENLGIVNGNITLAIEKKQPVNETDTTSFKMWQMQQKTYQLEFVASNMNHPGLVGLLEDRYLNTYTEINLNGITKTNFTITEDTASADIYRFRIIYKTINNTASQSSVISFKAIPQKNTILLDWKTATEINVKQSILEKSVDGIQFYNILNINDKQYNNATSSYQYIDQNISTTENQYRIKNIQYDGKLQYSQVINAGLANITAHVSVFPNPVQNNVIFLQMNNMPAGIYTTRLINSFGQLIVSKKIIYTGKSLMTKIETGKLLVSGSYQLLITKQGEKPISILVAAIKE